MLSRVLKQLSVQIQHRGFANVRFRPNRRKSVIAISAFGVTSGVIVGGLALAVDSLKTKLNTQKDISWFQNVQKYIYVITTHKDENGKIDTEKVWFPWLQSMSDDSRVLVRLAQCDDHQWRVMGVRALAEEHHWSDATYKAVAQSLDGRTLIGLARTPHADDRFFMRPHHLPYSKMSLQDQLRELVSKLPVHGLDKCTKYFTQKAMRDCAETKKLESEFVWSIDGHSINVEPSTSALDRMLVYSLRALIDFSYLPSYCNTIVKEGGLATLQRVYEARKGSTKILRCIALIMANLALHKELHADIIASGWIGVLHQWMNAKDLELSLKATKALANLDVDFGEKIYMEGVYLYHPQTRGHMSADIVFVHGLLGGPFRTWRQNDSAKPTEDQQEIDKIKIKKSYKTNHSDIESRHKHQNLNFKNDTGSVQNYSYKSYNNDSARLSTTICKCDARVDVETTLKANGPGIDLKHMLHLDNFERQKPDSIHWSGLKNKIKAVLKTEEGYSFCWPRDWLAKEIPHARILSVGYETYLNEWEAECPYESEKRALSVRSCEMLEKLRQAGIGDRPVIWVGHSMGGLLIKQMLVSAQEEPCYKDIVEQTKGIIFYSVPHRGSQLADFAKKIKHIYAPSVEVQELVTGCPKLFQLHTKFKALMEKSTIPLLSFAEGLETSLPFKFKRIIVPEESCDPGFGEFHVMKALTHLNTCKPTSKDSAVYRITVNFLHDCVPLGRVKNIIQTTLDPTVPGEW